VKKIPGSTSGKGVFRSGKNAGFATRKYGVSKKNGGLVTGKPEIRRSYQRGAQQISINEKKQAHVF